MKNNKKVFILFSFFLFFAIVIFFCFRQKEEKKDYQKIADSKTIVEEEQHDFKVDKKLSLNDRTYYLKIFGGGGFNSYFFRTDIYFY